MGTDVWVVVAIGAVLIFGASKLPQIARNMGKAQGEFKKGLKEGVVDPEPEAPAAPPIAAPPAAAAPEQPKPEGEQPAS